MKFVVLSVIMASLSINGLGSRTRKAYIYSISMCMCTLKYYQIMCPGQESREHRGNAQERCVLDPGSPGV